MDPSGSQVPGMTLSGSQVPGWPPSGSQVPGWTLSGSQVPMDKDFRCDGVHLGTYYVQVSYEKV